MPNSSGVFPFCVQDKLFKTERGDTCLCLDEAWPALFTDLTLLGPVFLVSRSEQMALMSASRTLHFAPVPGTTEMLELHSGVCVETLELGAVVAGAEMGTGSLSLHFFDLNGFGLFKVALAPGANREGFARLVRHYAKDSSSLGSLRESTPPVWCDAAVLNEERIHFQKAWTSFDPVMGGDFLPGGHGVSWWNALRLAGGKQAMFLTKVGLMKTILAAHHDDLRLSVTSWHGGLHHETTVTPRRLERCSQCFHLLDTESEAHFFFESDLDIWVGYHGPERLPAIHLFSASGQRKGLIRFAGKPPERRRWTRAVSAGITFREP